jgi:aldehyde:ferredoxin oxidoreductase
MGTVMASKKLKAIAIRGTGKVEVADKNKFAEVERKALQEAFPSKSQTDQFAKEPIWTGGFAEYGTALDVLPQNEVGRLPTKNWKTGVFAGASGISGEHLAEKLRVGRDTCPFCALKCNMKNQAEKPYVVDPSYGGPEYETCGSLGSLIMNGDPVVLSKANELCNKFGLDTIETGSMIALAMDCYENGLLDRSKTDGIPVTWGNHDAILKIIEKIARREGIGDILANGAKMAVQKIGKNADDYTRDVKGMSLAMHEPRGKKGIGVSYAIAYRGACHLQGIHDDFFEMDNVAPELGITKGIDRLSTDKKKVDYVIKGENWMTLCDSLLVCAHVYYLATYVGPSTTLTALNAATGWDFSVEEYMRKAEGIFNLVRAFSVREGVRRKDDRLPKIFSEPLPEGVYQGQSISDGELNTMLNYYYELRGWDNKTGIPKVEKLKELKLDFALRAIANLSGTELL